MFDFIDPRSIATEGFAEAIATLSLHGVLFVIAMRHRNRIRFHGTWIKTRNLFKEAFPPQPKRPEPADRRFQWRW